MNSLCYLETWYDIKINPSYGRYSVDTTVGVASCHEGGGGGDCRIKSARLASCI